MTMHIYTKQTQVSAVQCTEEWFAPGADLAALSTVKGTALVYDSEAPFALVPDGNGYALSLRLGDWLVRDEQGDLRVVHDVEFRATCTRRDGQNG
ncbi:MAG TPA: hypothetical protein VHO25_12600 [Polyangiaceae bacterium]|nr:hypothetical protein [Polyangiaceae bacterium]